MFNKYSAVPLAVAGLISLGAPSFAQNIPAWENNEAQKINQAISTGMVNPSQAQGLTTREMQIQQETAQYAMKQGGGYLTAYQQMKITGDLKDLDRRLNNDIKRNGNNGMGGYGYGATMPLMGMGTSVPLVGTGYPLVGTGVPLVGTGLPLMGTLGTGLVGSVLPTTGYNGYNNGYNSSGMLGGLSGIGSRLFHSMPMQAPLTPVATPASYTTPFQGITGYNHHPNGSMGFQRL